MGEITVYTLTIKCIYGGNHSTQQKPLLYNINTAHIFLFFFYIKTPENANLHRITTNITLMEESLMLMTRVINLVSVTYDKLFCSTSVHSRFLLEFVQFFSFLCSGFYGLLFAIVFLSSLRLLISPFVSSNPCKQFLDRKYILLL